ncbi:hypothetical protein GFS03_04000 [Sulfolobus sp. E5-1-F]|nr:hypothetical protein GFS03_04000 [Sulfolobus sp. E5-1-F]
MVDLLTYAGRLENLKDTSYEFVRADVRDEKLHEIIEKYKPEIVINFAPRRM